MKEISLSELAKNNYQFDKKSNFKLTNGVCIKCKQNFSYYSVKSFMKNRSRYIHKKNLWNTCSKCWYFIQTRENPEWIEKNRQAQLVAQNKPEQKIKNAKGVSNSWTSKRRKRASILMKKAWANEAFAKKALANIQWTDGKNIEKFNKIINKSLGLGGLKGVYNGHYYDSALELSYILYCENLKIQIKRYDLDSICYTDENNKNRYYVPDFIINNNTIIEVKGYGLFYNKNYQRNILKIQALEKFCNKINYDYRLIFNTDRATKQYYKLAKKIHHETQK